MPPAPAKVHVSLKSDPTGATVLRDGRALGKTPFEQELSASPARLSYLLKLDGHKDATVELPGEKGGSQTVKLAAIPPPAAAPPPRQASISKRPPSKPPSPPKAASSKPVKDGVVNPFK